MRKVTYMMSTSLDGYIADSEDSLNWTEPDDEVFRFFIDETHKIGTHLLGRKLYETMLYWETAAQEPDLDEATQDWIAVWNPLPKVVFSNTLTEVIGTARLASSGVADEIERLRDESDEGDIAIGGATLAAEVAALGLIDEYQVMLCPVLLGGGLPYFAHNRRRDDLTLVETRTFSSGNIYLRYRVNH